MESFRKECGGLGVKMKIIVLSRNSGLEASLAHLGCLFVETVECNEIPLRNAFGDLPEVSAVYRPEKTITHKPNFKNRNGSKGRNRSQY